MLKRMLSVLLIFGILASGAFCAHAGVLTKIKSELKNPALTADKTYYETTTKNKVFIISNGELHKTDYYFNYWQDGSTLENITGADATQYTRNKGVLFDEEAGSCYWWLRHDVYSASEYEIAYHFLTEGLLVVSTGMNSRVYTPNDPFGDPDIAVRPSVWLEIDS